jgi:enoyl-CoA hydratase/carnithine racemase
MRRHDHTAVLTIDRPEARNAINAQLAKELDDTFDELAVDNDIWVVVLTGEGERAFCAGQDLKELAAASSSPSAAPTRYRPRGGWGGITRRDLPKPLVAAVNGAALGGGFEIVLSSDIVVAEAHALFGLPEVKHGVYAAAGGLARIARRLPPSVAFELVLTGESISAEQAHRFGLVNRVVPTGAGLTTALAIAETICQASPLAVQLSKQVVRAALTHGEDEAFRLQDDLGAVLRQTEDFKEGPRAFLEKRPPRWRGR